MVKPCNKKGTIKRNEGTNFVRVIRGIQFKQNILVADASFATIRFKQTYGGFPGKISIFDLNLYPSHKRVGDTICTGL